MNASPDRRTMLRGLGALSAGAAASVAAIPAIAAAEPPDPVYAAMLRHRQAYAVLSDEWDQHRGGVDLEDEADKRCWYAIEMAEEDAFNALLTTKPTTKSGAIACVKQVADIGLVTEELGAWLVMLLDTPLVLGGAG